MKVVEIDEGGDNDNYDDVNYDDMISEMEGKPRKIHNK